MKYNFKTEPYEHQRKALERGYDKKFFAYFMDMGTGKSKVLLDNIGILRQRGEISCACIIAPKSVYLNWFYNELEKHLSSDIPLDVLCWSPSKSAHFEGERLQFMNPKPDMLKLLFMNVEALSTKRGADFLFSVAKAYPDMLLAVDESTTIKSRTAARTKALTRIAKHVKYKRILTGSPITQSPLDLFSQCEFLERGCLQQASYWGFLNRYAKVQRRTLGAHSFQQVMGYQNLDELNRIIQPFSYRVRKEECLDLPDKVYVQREVEFTPEQKAAYNTMKKAAMAFLAEGQVTASTVLSQMLRMQQICSGYVKTDEGVLVELPTNKIKALMAAIEETDGKMIIWCNFTHDLKRVAAELKAVYGEQSYRLFYGDVSTEDRTDIVNQFQDPASPLRFFVGQPRSGGYGLTLTEAKTVIYYSNGFDLEVRLQSEDRAHRIGQTNKVTYIDIVTAQSVDSKILFALRRKLNLATEVMAEGYKKWLV